MTRNEDAEALIRLAITRDAKSPKEIADRIGEENTFALMSASLAVAANRRFPAGTDLAEISSYTSKLRRRFPVAAKQLKPDVAEAVIRAARGEDDQLEGLDTDEVSPLLFILTYAMATESAMGDDDKEAFIDEVFALIRQG